MKRFRKFGSALVIAGVLAGVAMTNTARLEAAGKGGGSPKDAICDYLRAILAYEYTSPYIKVWAQALYDRYKCEP